MSELPGVVIDANGAAVFDPRDRAFVQNPYPTYRYFRERDPVHYSPLMKRWYCFRHADCLEVCKDTGEGRRATFGKTMAQLEERVGQLTTLRQHREKMF